MTTPITNEEINKQIGRLITEARQLRHLTLAQLSQLTGFTEQRLRQFEKGSLRSNCRDVILIARVLQVPVGFFFQDCE